MDSALDIEKIRAAVKKLKEQNVPTDQGVVMNGVVGQYFGVTFLDRLNVPTEFDRFTNRDWVKRLEREIQNEIANLNVSR